MHSSCATRVSRQILVEKAVQEKESSIIRAQGEARAAILIGLAASNNPGYLELQRLEHAREIATIVAKSGNQVYLSADNLLLNLLATARITLGGENSPGASPDNFIKVTPPASTAQS